MSASTWGETSWSEAPRVRVVCCGHTRGEFVWAPDDLDAAPGVGAGGRWIEQGAYGPPRTEDDLALSAGRDQVTPDQLGYEDSPSLRAVLAALDAVPPERHQHAGRTVDEAGAVSVGAGGWWGVRQHWQLYCPRDAGGCGTEVRAGAELGEVLDVARLVGSDVVQLREVHAEVKRRQRIEATRRRVSEG